MISRLQSFVLLAFLSACFGGTTTARASSSASPSHTPRHSLYDKMERCKAGKLGNPPCLEYKSTEQYVLLQDHAPNKPRSCLTVPTAQVTGIEDSQTVSNQKVRDLWADAWGEREKCFKNAPQPNQGKPEPASWTGLAINSESVRTQDQLHIHASCLDQTVKGIIDQSSSEFHAFNWTPVKIRRHTWYVQKLTSLTGKQSPFELIQSRATHNKKDDNYIGWHSLVVVSARGGDGYYLLDAYRENGYNAAGEAMLNQSCQH